MTVAKDDLDEAQKAMQTTLSDVHALFAKWLYLDPARGDLDFIDITLACAIDRDVAGDPVWMFLVAPSGAMKTETLRTLDGWHRAYTLDMITPRALVSGKRLGTDEDGKPIMGGILHALDGNVLTIKDFTAILSMPERDRQEVFGSFRNAYDGKLYKGVGSEREKVGTKASFGFIAGVTDKIDIYQKFATTLGERWLKIRQSPDRRKTTRKARQNSGKQELMREELSGIVGDFLNSLTFDTVPTYTPEQEEYLEDLADFVSQMRAWVYVKTWAGKVTSLDRPEVEVPTRAVQQLAKLGQMLALIRGHETVTDADMRTLARVARDSCIPKRLKLLQAYLRRGNEEALYADLAREAVMHYNSARIECVKMVASQIFGERIEEEEYIDRYNNERTRDIVHIFVHEDFKHLSMIAIPKEENNQ